MENVSYTAHISNKKSAITSKGKLLSVANHNLRKYQSDKYNCKDIEILRGTKDLFQDVKRLYYQEFCEAVKEYNEKQKRADRRIDDYFEHVAGLEQDLAVEIIFQCGDKDYWSRHNKRSVAVSFVYDELLDFLEQMLPEFKIANAVIHYDEASPHMHVVGVPVWEGAKKGLKKKVSKRNVFTPQTLSNILQGKLREAVGRNFYSYTEDKFAEKREGRNEDLSVLEYKATKEMRRVEDLRNQVENLEKEINYSKVSLDEIQKKRRRQELDLEYEKMNLHSISEKIDSKQNELAGVTRKIAEKEGFLQKLVAVLERIIEFVTSFRLLAPTIEEYANSVEQNGVIEAGNSYRGILYEIGRLLNAFKELIKEGLCWFPRLMKWSTSKGEVAPVFGDTNNGYSYVALGYMNVETREMYSKEELQDEIKAYNRTGTVEQLEANTLTLYRDLQAVMKMQEEERLRY